MEHGTIVNIGEQRFDRLRETGRFYIDKTDFIREWWEKGSTVTLITRPRRFGKTLNMSMIECFFSNKYPGRDDLFEGLSIWKFEQLEDDNNAVWSLLLATGYLKALNTASEEGEDDVWYTLALTNFEVQRMFRRMIKGWFRGSAQTASDEFIKALMDDNVQMMNLFMNKVALHTFSYFDSGNKPSGETEPERFYHGFVLGMMVNLADVYHIRSNRESGYGRYDVMLEPFDKSGKAFIFEFKVLNSYEDERTLADVLVHAHAQIEKMKYETELLAKGFGPEQIRKYGFAFQGKHCLIG